MRKQRAGRGSLTIPFLLLKMHRSVSLQQWIESRVKSEIKWLLAKRLNKNYIFCEYMQKKEYPRAFIVTSPAVTEVLITRYKLVKPCLFDRKDLCSIQFKHLTNLYPFCLQSCADLGLIVCRYRFQGIDLYRSTITFRHYQYFAGYPVGTSVAKCTGICGTS